MEKNLLRMNQADTRGQSIESKKSQDVCVKRSRNSKRRESQNFSNSKSETPRNYKPLQPTNKKNFSIDKRPRVRDNAVNECNSNNTASGSGLGRSEMPRETELNSVFTPGSKKQNWNQLLNFNYLPRERDQPHSYSKGGYNRGYVKKVKYNKEHYLKANCQFVVNADGDYKSFLESPDALMEWGQIEQIIIKSSETPECPICLYPPTAAKITKCGHIYCWPCILHYLALSDKTWRKCPICYDAVHKNDLKSALVKPFNSMNVNDVITFQLMRREKNSLNIMKRDSDCFEHKFPHITDISDEKIHSKLFLANTNEILSIINNEFTELNGELNASGDDCPENVFLFEALDLLNTRKDCVENNRKENVIDLNESHNDDSLVVDSENVKNIDWSQFYFFYQSIDGQNTYLHSLNSRMLQTMYGSLENAPLEIKGRILQKETFSMSEDLRKRMKYLQHLPISCQFEIVEIDLNSNILSNEVLDMFHDELTARKKYRQRRAREERIREKHIFEANERQLGKLVLESHNIDIDSNTQFPLHGLYDAASSPTLSEASGSVDHVNQNAGPSFAKMLTESPVNLWPALEKRSSNDLFGTSPSSSSFSSQKQEISKTKNSLSMDSDCDLEDDEYLRVPEFKSSFNAAIAEALEKVNINEMKDDGNHQTRNGSKKKKNKKTVLFSTGITFRK